MHIYLQDFIINFETFTSVVMRFNDLNDSNVSITKIFSLHYFVIKELYHFFLNSSNNISTLCTK